MIDLRHSLAVLASRMPWQQVEVSVAHLFFRRARTGDALPDLDLFGEAPAPVARKPNAVRSRVPLRTMIALLLYLKRAFGLSDEAVVERWSDSPNFQFCSGQAYFGPRLPCDATSLVKALTKARRIADQSRSRKNTSGVPKLYAWHAPEVECTVPC